MSHRLSLAGWMLIAVLVSAPTLSFAGSKKGGDRKFTVTCDIAEMPVQTVVLEQLRSNDSVIMIDSQHSNAAGHLVFSGAVPEPGLYRLRFIQDKFFILSLDKGETKITAKWPLDDFKVEGSASSIELKSFIDVAKPLLMTMNMSQRTMEAAKSSGNPSALPEAEKAFNGNKAAFSTYVKHYCDTTRYQPNAVLAANIFNTTGEIEFMEHFNALMQSKFTGTYMTRDYSVFLNKLKESMPQPTEVGDKAPELTLSDTKGNMVSLSSYKGKYVLLDFWASWCGPCRAENPNVVAAYNKYKDKNFTILSVSLDSKKEAWETAIAHDVLSWTQVSDLKGWQSAAAGKYSVRSIPTNFLIDPQGKIIAHALRGPELESKLEEVLK